MSATPDTAKLHKYFGTQTQQDATIVVPGRHHIAAQYMWEDFPIEVKRE